MTGFQMERGVLHVGGIALPDLAAEFGTPLYVYDAGTVRRTYRELKEAVGGLASIHYSVKANPNPEVIRVLLAEGAGVEIASAGEYVLARRAGCPTDAIVFAGPGKTAEELEFVLRRGVGEIHVESMEEIERISDIVTRLGTVARVAIRVNPMAEGRGGAIRMGGHPSPFGFDEERLAEVADAVDSRPGLRLTGIHVYAGTQVLDAEVLGRQWAHGIAVAQRLGRHLDRPIETIDLGGGLGIPYFRGETALDLARLGEIATELSEKIRADPSLASARVIVEPGRFLIGPAGVYATRVLSTKDSRGERFVIVDGGMHHHLAASGNLGQVVKKNYPIVAADRIREPVGTTVTVVGPLCTPLDTIARRVELPDLQPGDLIAVLQSGAYGLTASPVGFLSHPMPAEVLVDERRHRLIRPRGTYEAP